MDPQARLDYFRSELEGKLEKLRKDMEEQEKRLTAKVASLEARIDNVVRASSHARA